MEMMKQIIDQALSIQLPQLGQGQNVQAAQEENGFDSMVRRKCQEKDSQKPTEKETAGKQESVAEKEPQPKDGEEQPQELQAMAAAMLLQRPEIVEAQVRTEPQAAAPEAVPAMAQETAAQMPVVQEAVAESRPQQVQTQAAPQQQMEVQVAAPAETPEAAPVAQVLPEDTQPQDHLADTTEQPKTQEMEVSVTPGKAEETDSAEETPAEAPVFHEVEAVPVKVAEPQEAPVDLEAPKGTEQLAERLAHAEQADLSHVEVTLSPESLGKLTVEFTRGDNGVLSVVISATTPKAAAVLEQHTSSLQNLLAGSTQNEVRVEIRQAEEAPQQFLNPEGQNQQQRRQEQQEQGRQGREDHKAAQDFVQQLRLGLVGLDGSET